MIKNRRDSYSGRQVEIAFSTTESSYLYTREESLVHHLGIIIRPFVKVKKVLVTLDDKDFCAAKFVLLLPCEDDR